MRFNAVLAIFLLLGSSAGCLDEVDAFLDCGQRPSQDDRDWCYMEAGWQNHDLSYCGSIKRTDIKESCYFLVGTGSGDQTVCGMIQEDEDRRNWCYAVTTDDPSHCDAMNEATLKSSCYEDTGVKTGEASVCEKAASDNDRDWCFYNVAREKKDKSVCGRITQKEVQTQCNMLPTGSG
ncbi:MAG: hypothetical protein PHG85_06785 [Candidatus Altiarchaeota archaeon]|nr:hypothetical protein [Candidatus Altiarchaeota archaeon]